MFKLSDHLTDLSIIQHRVDLSILVSILTKVMRGRLKISSAERKFGDQYEGVCTFTLLYLCVKHEEVHKIK